ncbi:MAG: tryptophan 2,3-dioxygenase [Segetibacter sp.]|nr:tryptophan 2,3-dioxygenase [Segetibacter sp.]
MPDQLMYYSDYLELNNLLNSQHPKSFEGANTPAHDEMLFIIIHQATELWFKQILFELDFIMSIFNQQKINDNSEDLNLVRHRLNRIIKINELLNQQVSILDTMTPLDFLEFRNSLAPSSGFQSLQFRLIEARLGLQLHNRHEHDYYKRTNAGGFSTQDFETINTVENEPSLLQQVNRWLERMPFFNAEYWTSFNAEQNDVDVHPFWYTYRKLYKESLVEREKNKLYDFDYVFFEKQVPGYSDEQLKVLRTDLSPGAMRAALFIMLYRDFPVFQTSYQILDALIEIDHTMSNWRHRHFIMVRRMIGMRVGTGNTSGSGYLEGTLNKHYIFKDLSGLSTYLIERKKLPKLPVELVKQLSFAMSG